MVRMVLQEMIPGILTFFFPGKYLIIRPSLCRFRIRTFGANSCGFTSSTGNKGFFCGDDFRIFYTARIIGEAV